MVSGEEKHHQQMVHLRKPRGPSVTVATASGGSLIRGARFGEMNYQPP